MDRSVGAVDLRMPHLTAEPFGPAMQGQRAVIGDEVVRDAIEHEAGVLDTIGDAAGQRAEMRAVLGIGVESIEPQDDTALAARHRHAPVAHHDAVVDDVDLNARVADQPELIDPFAAEFPKA